MNFNDNKLVELVRPCSLIYDKSDPLFKNKEARRNAWNCIGEELRRKGNECEQRWNVLRTRYNTEKRELRKPSGSAGGVKRKWPLFDAFGFLDAHLVQKKTTGNIFVEMQQPKEDKFLPMEFGLLTEAAEVLASKVPVAAEEYISPAASTSTTFTDDHSQDMTPTPNMSALRKEINNRKRPRSTTDNNLNSAIENVQNYFKNKLEKKDDDKENGDMCFAKQIYYNLLDIKSKKRKTEIKIKILQLFLEAEDTDEYL